MRGAHSSQQGSTVRDSSSVERSAWHLLSADEVARRLAVDLAAGLDHAEAARRARVHGRNEIREGRARGPWRMLLDQFTDFMILVLIAAAVVSGVVGDVADTLVILAIVVLNAAVGFIQEYRAQRAVAALKRLAAPTARALRAGRVVTLPAAELVPGDVVLLEAGNIVPADLRLAEVHTLKAEEAALTGESQPVEKLAGALQEVDLPLGDRRNMAYKGTLVSYGRGLGVVVATGMATELGRIASLLSAQEEVKTPLQKRLARFGRLLALAVIALCLILFVVGVLRGEPVALMFLTAVSLAVAAIPEALPAVVTVALALGARRMVKHNALIRRLPAVETLGSVTHICSDKTGTLTMNRMRVEQAYADGRVSRDFSPAPVQDEPWSTLFHALALSNDAGRDDQGRVIGDPTEVALYLAAEHAGLRKDDLAHTQPRLAELPFDSERQCMTTLHGRAPRVIEHPHPTPLPQAGEGALGYVIAYTKGAPEKVFARCRDVLTNNGRAPLDHAALQQAVERLAADGSRVLAVALRRGPALPMDPAPETVETGLTLLGLVGLMDPPRPEAGEAVALCRSAGITPVMITGDHPATAQAVARRLGLIDQGGEVMTGRELARLPLREFEQRVERVRVYARMAPEQKIKIVQALQDRGEYVAMTGDGVNDAPALKRADIGVAMGVTGTDVAKEAAHMILLDDNFATLVAAVREGRRIFDNIRKFIRFVMTGNSGEILTLVLAPFLGLPIPLLPIHILWVNLVTDGLPGLALAAEPEEPGVMQRPPRPPRESLLAHGLWQHIVWVGLLIGALCLITQAWALEHNAAHAQTMVFTVLTLSQMGHALAIRSERVALWRQGLFTNLPLLGAVLLTFLLQLVIVYWPVMHPVFKTQPLSASELVFCLAASMLVFVAVEIEKALIRHGGLYAEPGAQRV
ncbi:MAG: cation-translocating P-type ATPase [Gammaproteobacteria bacterium]|nr:cation-translocating P-type ATPase [Gammaproteobacteria bacterium]